MAHHWSETDLGRALVAIAFETANLHEVDENELEIGTYTNAQVAVKCSSPTQLVALLMKLPDGGGNASRRSVLSFAVDMI